MECLRLLLKHLAWIEHQFLSGIRDSRKARSLWGMMRGKGVQEEIPREEASTLQTAYFHYFDCKIDDQGKSWAPHISCKPCYNGLTAWFNGKKAAFNFAVSMVWREPQNHADDCYFCLTNITGFNASSRKKIKYPNLRSAKIRYKCDSLTSWHKK